MENSGDMKLAFMEVISDPVIIRKLESVFKPIADTITKAIQHQSQAMDSLRRQLEAKDEAIKKLTKQNQNLEARIDDLEQHGRLGSIRVFGVPEDLPGTTDDKILSICNENLKLDPKLSIEDIEVSHHLGKEPPQPREGETRSDPKRPIIVKFSSRRTKGRVMESCKLLKTNPPKDSDGEPLKVYIGDDLTKRRAYLAYQARQLKRSKKITDTWVVDTKIYVKDNYNRIRRINSTEDLQKISPD